MALIRRLNIVDFKEVVVEYPELNETSNQRDQALSLEIPINIYIDESITGQPGSIAQISDADRNVTLAYSSISGRNKVSNSGTLIGQSGEDQDSDGIPDLLDIDVDNDGGGIDSPEGDFVGVIKRTFLLAKVELWDCTDDGTMTPQQFYQQIIQNIATPGSIRITEFSRELDGWLVIGESKSSFYYERCITELNGKVFSGRLPVSKNYFDIADLWIRKNQNGTWNFVSGEGENPMEPVFQFDIMGDYTILSRLINTGFDWSFGPKLSSWSVPLQFKTIYQYFVKNNIVSDGIGPGSRSGLGVQMFPDLKRINYKLRPVNLHYANRLNAFKESGDYYSLNESDESIKPYWKNGFSYPLYDHVDTVYKYNDIPSIIKFDDGKKDRFGTPFFVIQNAFTLNNQTFVGTCIPAPNEDPVDYDKSDDADDSINPSEYRTRVTISDVLSRKVKLDGTNYIRGIVTSHFTFPLKSYTSADIDNLYAQFSMYPEGYNLGAMFLGQQKVDPYTFAKEMRNVVYIQDETAGMELLGTDFYSLSGLEYKGLSENIPLTGFKSVDVIGDPLTMNTPDIMVMSEEDELKYTESGIGPPERVAKLVNMGPSTIEFPEPTVISTKISINSKIPATSYWETDTGYVPYDRYHFKVGDFIEIYNLNILNRQYAARTCKIVNGEYRVIPNDVNDVNEYLEKNGYVKEVDISKLTRDDVASPQTRESNSPSVYSDWKTYDYKNENSIHRFENCLVKIKNVGFCTADSSIDSEPLSRKRTSKTLLISNDDGPFFDENNNEYYGFKFEPCSRFLIRDLSSGDYDKNFGGKKTYVYIPCSTEMGEHFLQIPGIPSRIKKNNTSADYLRWKNKKKSEGNFIDFEDTYEWPLTITGILRRSMVTDFSVTNGDFYEIWPRVYSDLGIITPKKQTKVSKTDQPPSGMVGPSINLDPKNIGGTGTNIPGGPRVINVGGGALPGTGSSSGRRPAGGGGASSTGTFRPTCFPRYTNILTPSGQVPIIDLNIGDFVTTFDNQGNLYERPITHKFIHDGLEKSDIYRYHLSNGKILDITENHPVLTKIGFIHIGNLKIGDSLIDVNDSSVSIISKEFLNNDIVYNIEVDEYNAYIAESIKVHNLTKKTPEIPIVEGGDV